MILDYFFFFEKNKVKRNSSEVDLLLGLDLAPLINAKALKLWNIGIGY